MRLVLASNNAKKLSELQALLVGVAVDLVAQGTLGVNEAEEPHITFIENALAKARHAAAATGDAAIADDSGVCVDALDGAPGVVSAHYAGELPAESGAGGGNGHGIGGGSAREARRRLQDAANNTRLLAELQGVSDRRAHFVCTLVAVKHASDPQPLVAVGRWSGEILTVPRGNAGFGYDPLMFVQGEGRTVAEMDSVLKNAISHRALAAAQLRRLFHEVWRL